MEEIRIAQIASFEDREVHLSGWLYNKRSSGKLHFLQLRDGSGIVQCVVFKGDVSEEVFELCSELSDESSIKVRGRVRKDPRAPIGFELGVTGLECIHLARPYPVSPKSHGVAFLMDHRHLWLRSSRTTAILRVRSEVVKACRDFLEERDFILIDAPILTPAACEGTTTLFETDYFGNPAYLTQSGQLYMEAAAMAFGKVYCFGPTFRSEKSKTRRHLNEFWMVEPEMAFCDLQGSMNLAEDMVTFVVSRVLERRRKELDLLERDVTRLEKIQKPFPRISYGEAVDLLHARGSDIQWGTDLGGDDETLISDQFESPVLVHRYPLQIKAFYMKADPADGGLALCMDMLAPEGYGEIIGGGQREDQIGALERRIDVHGLPKKSFEWYLDLRRYGSVPHAGFGMGIERVVAWICGLHHVRETIPFPRTLHRLYP